MKKKIFGGIAFVAVALAIAFNMNGKQESQNLSELALANIEALAGENESGTQTKCDPGYVPDRYLRSPGPKSVTYTTNSSGQVNIGGVLYAGYQKNTTVILVVETFNCDGIQIGACCDQSKVGTKPV